MPEKETQKSNAIAAKVKRSNGRVDTIPFLCNDAKKQKNARAIPPRVNLERALGEPRDGGPRKDLGGSLTDER